MQYPLATGQAARLLNTTEPQLAEMVRRGRINPPPPITAGRRLWQARHLRQAAKCLKLHNETLDQLLSDAGLKEKGQ